MGRIVEMIEWESEPLPVPDKQDFSKERERRISDVFVRSISPPITKD